MKRFMVMTGSDGPRGDGLRFIRDGFQPLALVLPLVWLLWNRLWLQAALVFAATGLAAFAAGSLMPAALPVVTGLANFAAGFITAHEGGAWHAADLEMRGHAVQEVIVAGSVREAEEIYASRLPETAAVSRPASRGFQPVSQASLIPLAGA